MPSPSMKAVISSFMPVRSSGCGDMEFYYCKACASQPPLHYGGQSLAATASSLPGKTPFVEPRVVLNFLLTKKRVYHALFQRICGLSGPRSFQKTGGERSH